MSWRQSAASAFRDSRKLSQEPASCRCEPHLSLCGCQHRERWLCSPWGNSNGIPHRILNASPSRGRFSWVFYRLRSYKGMSWSNQTMPTLVCSSEMLRTLSLGRKQPESPTNLFFVMKAGKPISGFLTEGHWLSCWDVLKEEELGSSGPGPGPIFRGKGVKTRPCGSQRWPWLLWALC